MPDLDVPTAVREMLDRSTEAARLRPAGDLRLDDGLTAPSAVPLGLAPRPVGDEADLVLVDLTAPPRRNRLALLAAALVAAAAVGGGLVVAASSGPDAVPERTGMAALSAPPVAAAGEDEGPSATGGSRPGDPGARLTMDGDRLTLLILGPGELVESVPVSDAPPAPGPAADLLLGARVIRVGPPAERPAPDEWNGAVHLASGEPAALRGDGDARTVEIDAGDAVIVFGDVDPALGAEDLARTIGGIHLERAD